MVSLMDGAYLAVGFVVLVVTLGVSATVLTGITNAYLAQPNNATCIANPTAAGCSTVASNASYAGLGGTLNFASQSGTIGTILAATIILGLLMGAFLYSRN